MNFCFDILFTLKTVTHNSFCWTGNTQTAVQYSTTPCTKLIAMWKVLQADTLCHFVQTKTIKSHMTFLFRWTLVELNNKRDNNTVSVLSSRFKWWQHRHTCKHFEQMSRVGVCVCVCVLERVCVSGYKVEASWNVMAHAQKPVFVFWRNERVHLNRRGRQFSRLLAAEVCTSVVVMLDTLCSEVVWRVLATHSIRQFPLHFPSCASLCAIIFQLDSTKCIWQCSADLLLQGDTAVLCTAKFRKSRKKVL